MWLLIFPALFLTGCFEECKEVCTDERVLELVLTNTETGEEVRRAEYDYCAKKEKRCE